MGNPEYSLPYLSKNPNSEAEWFQALADLARYLRTPEGCPWDREHNSRQFAGFSVDEAREFAEALDTPDHAHAAEEFGDCFFTLLAAAAAAEEEGRFRLEDALRFAHEKMVRRHDHVFGETKATSPEAAVEAWNRIKAEEKARKAREAGG